MWAFWSPGWPSQVTFLDSVRVSTGHLPMKLQEEAMAGSSTGAVCFCMSEWQWRSEAVFSASGLMLWVYSLCYSTSKALKSLRRAVSWPSSLHETLPEQELEKLLVLHPGRFAKRRCGSKAPSHPASLLLPSFNVPLALCIRCCDTGQRQYGNAPVAPSLECTVAVLKRRAD